MSEIKTAEIRARDLGPCDLCGGKINPAFLVVTVKHAVIDQRGVRILWCSSISLCSPIWFSENDNGF